MHELAFGDQRVDLTKGADNSGITRHKDIEEWAKDVYEFMSKSMVRITSLASMYTWMK